MFTQYETISRDDRRYLAAVQFAVAFIEQGTMSRHDVARNASNIADELVKQIDEYEQQAHAKNEE